jgi:uncharacterized delta-60 repeat protein
MATIMKITGTNFSTTPGNNSVVFTPAVTGTVTAATATSLTVSSLSGLTFGPLNAVVTTNGQTSGSAVQVATVVAPGTGDVDPLSATVVNDYVLASAVQPDGKILIAGGFTSVLGQPRNRIARLNADGTLDAGFNPDANNDVFSVVVQADGGILLGGWFTSVGGTARNRIARVNAAGTLDAGFDPDVNGSVLSVAVQADGGILFGGLFTSVGGTARNNIARVDAAGALDAGFNPDVTNNTVFSVAVQADSRILIGGAFTSVSGITRNRIARVDSAGTLDLGFNPNANNIVYTVAVQADGRILLGGSFTGVGGTTRNRIARVDAAGTLDASFNPNANSNVLSVAVQTDGRILLGGAFTSVGGTTRNSTARVNAAGALDAGFNPNAEGSVTSVTVQADGRILLGGYFNSVAWTANKKFARLLNDPATQTLNAADATQVTWTRGGSSPEVSQVIFEKSTDSGASWTPLGIGTRIGSTPDWQLTGLSLPAGGQLRVRGRTTGGESNGSSGLVEQVVSFNIPLQTWRQLYFGTTANAGDAADTFDFDQDGLVNLIEFAFGLDPKLPSSSAQLPQPSLSGGNFAFSFTQPDGVSGITYGAEWSSTLLPGSWTAIPDTGNSPQQVFSLPTTGQPKIYTRLVVTAP